MEDKVLRQFLIDELDFEPSIDAANIGVAVENGVVTLSGHAGSYAEKIAAERAVQRVKGVKAIAQEIEVRYPDHSKRSDDEIAQRALKILNWSVQVPADSLQVMVEKGWITLSGTVPWQYQRLAAESALRKLSGIVGVTNLVEIQPQVEASGIRQKIVESLKRNAELEADSIRVVVDNDKVTLEGKVKAWYERELAERAAWSAPGVRSVVDRLTLS
ncbi:MAG: BON domain-containing protein [Beijerinckiaceae bacterium]|nr:BON domain-containing protein [Beijerinckiaceae bacterium]